MLERWNKLATMWHEWLWRGRVGQVWDIFRPTRNKTMGNSDPDILWKIPSGWSPSCSCETPTQVLFINGWGASSKSTVLEKDLVKQTIANPDPGILWGDINVGDRRALWGARSRCSLGEHFFYASGYQISMWEIAVLFQMFLGWLMLLLCISLSAMSVGASSKNSAFCLVAWENSSGVCSTWRCSWLHLFCYWSAKAFLG